MFNLLEVTLLRSDLCEFTRNKTVYPTELDAPCDKSKPEWELTRFLPRKIILVQYMVVCVLVSEDEGNVSEVDIDITGRDLYRVLKGTATFVGQIPDTNVVIMKCDTSLFELLENRNKLPEPFHDEVIFGPILFIHMDENADPQDFRLSEYLRWNPSLAV